MLAMYRDGRQADSLAAYQAVRAMLVGELGTEPGTELRDLHRKILAHDTAIARRVPTRLTRPRWCRRAGRYRAEGGGANGSYLRRPGTLPAGPRS